MKNRAIRIVSTVAVILALFVVMLGAYTRLTDAGLGCPDWPGCYGKMILPDTGSALKEAQSHFPQIPIESRKAWTEMAHRYVAGTLGLLIFFIAFSVLRKRIQDDPIPWHLPCALFFLVLFQALLGMWTVTLQLLPVVVMGHLLGGILIFACLSRFRLQMSSLVGNDLPQWRPWLRLGVVVVFFQIALGGWVSSNYAGIACIGFPTCNGAWFPQLYFAKGFNLWSLVGANYQGGLLDNEVRITIQWVHRLGAIITAGYVLILSACIILKNTSSHLKKAAVLLATLVLVQFLLGIMNVLYLLPIDIAVAHNGVAALLLALIFSMLHFARKGAIYV